MKKILWLLLLALFSLMNIQAQEFKFTHEGHTLKYVRNPKGVTCDYAQSNISGTVKIPSKVYFEGDTFSVTKIEEGAFYKCHNVYCIVLPNSIKSIGNRAFSHCKNLKKIILSDSIIDLGNYTFENCLKLTSVVIPRTVTILGNSVFYNCESLQEVVLPNTITSIGDQAFKGCLALKKINIPESVTEIKTNVFENCENLEKVVIPKSVKKIGAGLFFNCLNLNTVILEAETPPSIELSFTYNYIFLDTHDIVSTYELFSESQQVPIYVPDGSVETYKKTYRWSNMQILPKQ
jgi:hypothetical protein